MAQELATVFVGVTADTKKLETELKRAETEALKAASGIEQALAKSSKDGVDKATQNFRRLQFPEVKPPGTEKLGAELTKSFKAGVDDASAGIERLAGGAGRLAGIIASPFLLGLAAATAFAAGLVLSIRQFIQFDEEFARLRAVSELSSAQLNQVRTSLQTMSPFLGTSTELTKLFRIALVDVGEAKTAEEVTRIAAALSQLSGTPAPQVVQTLTSLLDSFGESAGSATRIADLLFVASKRGAGDLANLGPQLSSLGDISREFGIGLDELAGALITLGRTAGAEPQKNLIALRTALTALSFNVEKIREKGIDLEKTIEAKGLVGVLEILNELTGGSAAKLRELGISGRNLTAVQALLRESTTGLVTDIQSLNQAVDSGEGVLKGFGTFTESTSAQLSALGTLFANIAVEVGEQFGPVLNDVLKLLRETVEALTPAFVFLAKAVAFALEPIRLLIKAGKLLADTLTEPVARILGLPPALQQVGPAGAAAEAGAKKAASGIDQIGKSLDDVQKKRKLGALGGISTAEQKAAEDLLTLTNKTFSEVEARQQEHLAKAIERDKASALQRISSNLSIVESEQSLEAERAKFEGREIAGLERVQEARRASAEQRRSIELSSIEQSLAAQQRAVEIRVANVDKEIERVIAREDLGRTERQRLLIELNEQKRRLEEQGTELTKDAAAKRTDIETKSTEEIIKLGVEEQKARRAAQQERLKLADDEFRFGVQLGRTTVQDQLDRLAEIASASNRSLEDRRRAVIDFHELQKKLINDVTELARSRGELTLLQQVQIQQRITAATIAGTQQRLDAEKKLADLRNTFASQATSAAQGILGIAKQQLGIDEQDLVTKSQIVKATEDAFRKAETTVEKFLSGQKVAFGELNQAFQTLGQSNQLKQLGLGVSDTLATGFGLLLNPAAIHQQFLPAGVTAGQAFAAGFASVPGVLQAFGGAVPTVPGAAAPGGGPPAAGIPAGTPEELLQRQAAIAEVEAAAARATADATRKTAEELAALPTATGAQAIASANLAEIIQRELASTRASIAESAKVESQLAAAGISPDGTSEAGKSFGAGMVDAITGRLTAPDFVGAVAGVVISELTREIINEAARR